MIATVDISRAQQIPGWMTDQELRWLAEHAAQCDNRIVEIGSWMGRSALAMADNSFAEIFAIDTWEGSPTEDLHRLYLKDKPPFYLLEQFRSNLNGHVGVHVVPVTMSSLEAALRFSADGIYFDMVFIDADHRYESVLSDIVAWQPRVCAGGLLCGHDYGDPGVTKAVDELIPNRQRSAEIMNSIWWVHL